MIEHENSIVVLDLVDLEHCGFRVSEFHAELEMAGIDDPAARWPVALLVNFAGGVVITPETTEATRALMEEAGQQFRRLRQRITQTGGRCYVLSERVGYVFYVEGEYCENLQDLPDPADEDWVPFQMQDLHPGGEDRIAIWTHYSEPCPEAEEEAIAKAITIVEWMREEKDWEGFDASLWLWRGEQAHKRVFRWELV
jgi:hypothetical protein